MAIHLMGDQTIYDFSVQTHQTNKRKVIVTSSVCSMGDEESMTEVFQGFDENDQTFNKFRRGHREQPRLT